MLCECSIHTDTDSLRINYRNANASEQNRNREYLPMSYKHIHIYRTCLTSSFALLAFRSFLLSHLIRFTLFLPFSHSLFSSVFVFVSFSDRAHTKVYIVVELVMRTCVAQRVTIGSISRRLEPDARQFDEQKILTLTFIHSSEDAQHHLRKNELFIHSHLPEHVLTFFLVHCLFRSNTFFLAHSHTFFTLFFIRSLFLCYT